MLAETGSIETYKIFRYIFLIDPFWNFADSMNYNMIRNFIKSLDLKPEDFDSTMA